MSEQTLYPIGEKGKKWTQQHVEQWFDNQKVKRSYQIEVVEKLQGLRDRFTLEQYGELTNAPEQYPLFALRSKQWQEGKPSILVTGGVHGYETSGVHGAIRFLQEHAAQYESDYNIIVAPCVSPWGYETINRWDPLAIDPNRSFYLDSPAEESKALMNYLSSYNDGIVMHIDLHETTDTDNSEFRPALAARDAIEQKSWNIPDGFYLVGDSVKPEPEFQKAIIDAVQKVTHIAPADDKNELIGAALEQFGVINYAARSLGLCMGMTDAAFVTTTEVYPDSSVVDDENCILAQVAAITSAIDYVKAQK